MLIPDELTSLHTLVQGALRAKSKQRVILDYVYYNIERGYLEPLFERSHLIQIVCKNLSSSKNLNSYKRKFRKYSNQILEHFHLLRDDHWNIKLKYSKTENNYSYYSSVKRSIFIDHKMIERAFQDKDETIMLLYTLMHEIGHAISDIWFCNDGNHNHLFHYSNMLVFKHMTNINITKVYNQKHKEQTFDQRCEKDGAFLRIGNKNIKIEEFDNYTTAIQTINKRHKVELEYRKSIAIDNETEDRYEVPSFIYNKQFTDLIRLYNKDGNKLKKIFRFVRIKDSEKIKCITINDSCINEVLNNLYINHLYYLKNSKEELLNERAC